MAHTVAAEGKDGDGDRSSARGSLHKEDRQMLQSELAKQQNIEDLLVQKDSEKEGVDKEIDGSWPFKVFVETMIVINAVQLGMCVQKDEKPELTDVCNYSEHLFISIFLIELLYRMYSLGFSYFKWKWNVFDFVLTATAVLDNWVFSLLLSTSNLPFGNIYVLRLARLLRILRILRVLKKKKELQMLMEGLLAALRNMIWVSLLLGFLIYCCAIVCVTLFSTVQSDYSLTFHTLPQAIFSLFTLACLADWTDIVMPVIAAHPWAALMFVMFTIVSTFGILNLIIGVITETTMKVQREFKAQEKLSLDIARMRNIEEIADIIFAMQEDNTITKDELQVYVDGDEHGPSILELVQGICLPEGFSLLDCHPMFDRDASGSITKEEFIQGMKRLIFSNEFQRACTMQSAIADVLVEVKACEEQLLVEVKQVEERLTGVIKEEVRSLRQDILFAASVGGAGGNDGGGDSGAGREGGATPQLLARSGSKTMPSEAKPAEVTSEYRREAEAGGGIVGVLNFFRPLESSLEQLKTEFGGLLQVVERMDRQLFPPPENRMVLEAVHDKRELQALGQRLLRRLREPMSQLLADSLEAEVSAGTASSAFPGRTGRHGSDINGSGDANVAQLATARSSHSQPSALSVATSEPAGNERLAPRVRSRPSLEPRLRSLSPSKLPQEATKAALEI